MTGWFRPILYTIVLGVAATGCHQIPQYAPEPASAYSAAAGPSCSSCSSCGLGHARSPASDVWSNRSSGH